MERVRKQKAKDNLRQAFDLAEKYLDVPKILDPSGGYLLLPKIFLNGKIMFSTLFLDVDMDNPDEKSIITYVAQFLRKYPSPRTARVRKTEKFERLFLFEKMFSVFFLDSNDRRRRFGIKKTRKN